MRSNVKTDRLIHTVVFKQHQDIVPKYSKDFEHACIIFEYLFTASGCSCIELGYSAYFSKFYCELSIENDIEELTIKKYESSMPLAICAVALSYFGKGAPIERSADKV